MPVRFVSLITARLKVIQVDSGVVLVLMSKQVLVRKAPVVETGAVG